MADDIDDLLREVEEKFLPPGHHHSKQQNSNHHAQHQTNYQPRTQSHQVITTTAIINRRDVITGAASAPTKPTARAHSSDLILHELEDDLSDLLDEVGRISDAATVSLRCKRSPRRSASARELLLTGNGSGNVTTEHTKNTTTSTAPQPVRPSINQNASPNGAATSNKAHSNRTRNDDFSITAIPPDAYVEKEKCYPIYLSGVIDSIDSNQAVRVCNGLRCMGCDFRVSQFAHYKWRPGVDYLFLRNHMPEFDRVRVKLATAKFCRAYACQCKFVTVKDLVDLTKLGSEFASQWVCMGH